MKTVLNVSRKIWVKYLVSIFALNWWIIVDPTGPSWKQSPTKRTWMFPNISLSFFFTCLNASSRFFRQHLVWLDQRRSHWLPLTIVLISSSRWWRYDHSRPPKNWLHGLYESEIRLNQIKFGSTVTTGLKRRCNDDRWHCYTAVLRWFEVWLFTIVCDIPFCFVLICFHFYNNSYGHP